MTTQSAYLVLRHDQNCRVASAVAVVYFEEGRGGSILLNTTTYSIITMIFCNTGTKTVCTSDSSFHLFSMVFRASLHFEMLHV